MTNRPSSVRALVVGAALLAACSNDEEPNAATTTLAPVETTTTTTAPERPTSTTTTTFDPASVEGQVEAAYLRSWDVYADAVYNLELDEAALTEVYAEEALETLRNEILQRIDDREPSLVRVDHNYEIGMADATSANVIDQFTNHQVLIDPESFEPIEPDPNEPQLINFSLKQVDGRWKVTHLERVGP